jgi:hypothetical protein
MFKLLLPLILAAASVSSLVVPRQNPPAAWATDYLEVCLSSSPLYNFLTCILALSGVP